MEHNRELARCWDGGCSCVSWSTEDGKHLWGRNYDFDRIARGTAVTWLPAGTAFPTAGLGRVCTRSRGRGLGRAIVAAGIQAARDRLGAEELTIEAQTYVRALYEGFGFRQTSEEFLEDGIPHIQMKWKS